MAGQLISGARVLLCLVASITVILQQCTHTELLVRVACCPVAAQMVSGTCVSLTCQAHNSVLGNAQSKWRMCSSGRSMHVQ